MDLRSNKIRVMMTDNSSDYIEFISPSKDNFYENDTEGGGGEEKQTSPQEGKVMTDEEIMEITKKFKVVIDKYDKKIRKEGETEKEINERKKRHEQMKKIISQITKLLLKLENLNKPSETQRGGLESPFVKDLQNLKENIDNAFDDVRKYFTPPVIISGGVLDTTTDSTEKKKKKKHIKENATKRKNVMGSNIQKLVKILHDSGEFSGLKRTELMKLSGMIWNKYKKEYAKPSEHLDEIFSNAKKNAVKDAKEFVKTWKKN